MLKKTFFIWLGWTALWTVGEGVVGGFAWLALKLHHG